MLLVGVDPAKNIFKKNKGLIFLNNFFNFSKGKEIRKKFGKFDLIFARNVLAHVTDPNEIFKGAKELLLDNGVFIVEVPHLLPILKNLQYDNVFHEHQGFHSIKSIKDLSTKNGLYLNNVELIKSQGGSIRCDIRKYNKNINKKVLTFLDFEKKNNLFDVNFLKRYKNKILDHNKNLLSFLKKLKDKGKKFLYMVHLEKVKL